MAIWPWNLSPFQYQKRRLIVRSCEVSKPPDWHFKSLHHFEIWQAHRQQCCWGACLISEQSDNSKYKYCGFETSWDFRIKHLIWYWNGLLSSSAAEMTFKCKVAEKLGIQSLKNTYLIRNWENLPVTFQHSISENNSKLELAVFIHSSEETIIVEFHCYIWSLSH